MLKIRIFKPNRGQKYFSDNRAGIVIAIFYGVFAIISDPLTAEVLDRTGMSSTPLSAKKRYAQTTLHMIAWYESELKTGSKYNETTLHWVKTEIIYYR